MKVLPPLNAAHILLYCYFRVVSSKRNQSNNKKLQQSEITSLKNKTKVIT